MRLITPVLEVSVNVSILSIGDEIVFGEIADTNAAFIGSVLYDHGIKVVRHLAVGDREENIVEAVRYLAERSDVVIATGGLGPTDDDITAAAAARAAGGSLDVSEAAREHVRNVTCKLGGNLSLNEKQALVPRGAVLIPNPTGTACGFELDIGACTFFFLPGVPSEMMHMVEETVLPAVVRRSAGKRTVLTTKVLKVSGIAEATLGPLLRRVIDERAGVTVAYAVQFPEILIKLRTEGKTEQGVAKRLAAVTERVRAQLRDYLFAEDDDTIDTVVAGLLRRTGVTLSLAESCTGGLLAKRITDLSGSSAYFLEGAVTYSDKAKQRTLRVPPEVIRTTGAVSPETATAMATGMRKRTGSDVAIAITGIAGPDGGSMDKPVGTVYISLASRHGCHASRFLFSGDRGEIRLMTTHMALDMLRRYLLMLLDEGEKGACNGSS